jgi:hypothetical protein
MRLLQLKDRTGRRRVGVVEDERVHLLNRVDSVYALAQHALAAHESLVGQASKLRRSDSLSYDEIYAGSSDWRIMPAIDHPREPARCLLSGTGLTHLKSAQSRQAMHASGTAPSDSMRMYEWGVEGGRPAHGQIGISPEWFYKGCGTMLRAHGEPLLIPPHAEDGGEEAEIAGIYIIDAAGSPRRLGIAIGNEFSDHVVEKKNYLYLASSKLMFCAIGPELVTDAQFDSLAGEVAIKRNGELLWRREIHSGEKAMCHSLANIEYHHFKHPLHRRPGDVHVHFFGADAFSSGENVKLKDGDVMRISFAGMGRALVNPVALDATPQTQFCASPL